MIATSLPSLPALPDLPPLPGSNPTGAHTQWSAGRINFENCNYLISSGEDGSVWVANKNTQEQYLAWGSSQLWVDGQPAFSFSGSTSLALHDGTLLTLNTVPVSTDPLVTTIHKVTITHGAYGVEILGLGGAAGSMRFVETHRYGGLLNAAVPDGNLIHENRDGQGFVGMHIPGEEGELVWLPVDQDYIDATDLAHLADLAGSRGRAFLSLHTLLVITFAGAFRGPMAYRFSEWVDTPLNPNDPGRDDSSARQWRLRVPRDGACQWEVAVPTRAR
jgi:hypothetical protein